MIALAISIISLASAGLIAASGFIAVLSFLLWKKQLAGANGIIKSLFRVTAPLSVLLFLLGVAGFYHLSFDVSSSVHLLGWLLMSVPALLLVTACWKMFIQLRDTNE